MRHAAVYYKDRRGLDAEMTPPGDSRYHLTRRVIVSMRNHQPERGQSLEPMPSRLRLFRWCIRLPGNNQEKRSLSQVQIKKDSGSRHFCCVLGDAPHVPR